MKITYDNSTKLITLDGSDFDMMENPVMTKSMAFEFIEWMASTFPDKIYFVNKSYLDTKFDEIKKLLGA